MTREEALTRDGTLPYSRENLINQIFDEHEAQLRAKDEKIERLNLRTENLHADVCHIIDRNISFKNQAKKARKMCAMLFWEWRKDKRIYENANKYTKETAELYVNCSELSFKKAYAMLKATT